MNTEMESLIGVLVADLPKNEQNGVREILRSCQFQESGDPVFGLLRYLHFRAKSNGDREHALAASVAKLAEEMDSRLWEARRLKIGFFAGCVALALLVGFLGALGLTFHAARTNPVGFCNYMNLSAEHRDERIIGLENAGVRFRVGENQPGYIAVGLTGKVAVNQTNADGEIVVLFQKRR